MQIVLLPIEQHVVLIGRIENTPALHLARAHSRSSVGGCPLIARKRVAVSGNNVSKFSTMPCES